MISWIICILIGIVLFVALCSVIGELLGGVIACIFGLISYIFEELFGNKKR